MIKEPEICESGAHYQSLKELSTRRVLHDDSEMGRSQNHLGIQNTK